MGKRNELINQRTDSGENALGELKASERNPTGAFTVSLDIRAWDLAEFENEEGRICEIYARG